MKKLEFAYALIAVSLSVLVIGCDKQKDFRIYSKIWEQPTALDTNFIVNGVNNPNMSHKVDGFYGPANIIIDTSNVSYFYNYRLQYHSCCVDRSNLNTAEFINLTPYQMVVIPNEYLESFLDINLKKNSREHIFLSIASPVDTIKQESFRIIAEYLKKHPKRYYFAIRLITEEEKNVLYCKKNNIEYDKDHFKWKTEFSNIAPKFTKVSPIIYNE